MTYTDLVNNVLRRLREDEVEFVAQSAYSKLIGDFVNDAKTIVESSWKWTGQKQEVTVNAFVGDRSYSIPGSGTAFQLVNAINDTSDNFLEYQSANWFDKQINTQDLVQGSPSFYTVRGFDSNKDSIVEVYPIPDTSYTLLFNIIKDPADLVEDTDELLIPHQPIIQMAFAMALRERGETGGQSAAEQFVIAEMFLSDAIALDANRNPEQLIWKTV
tara:strand:- start:3222 stop:3869 length:648 start_codon:yes stop_codon:yes gene_type:complete